MYIKKKFKWFLWGQMPFFVATNSRWWTEHFLSHHYGAFHPQLSTIFLHTYCFTIHLYTRRPQMNIFLWVGARFSRKLSLCASSSLVYFSLLATFPPRKAPVLSVLSTLRTVLLVFLSTCHDYLVFLEEPFPRAPPVSSVHVFAVCTTTLTAALIFVYH